MSILVDCWLSVSHDPCACFSQNRYSIQENLLGAVVTSYPPRRNGSDFVACLHSAFRAIEKVLRTNWEGNWRTLSSPPPADLRSVADHQCNIRFQSFLGATGLRWQKSSFNFYYDIVENSLSGVWIESPATSSLVPYNAPPLMHRLHNFGFVYYF